MKLRRLGWAGLELEADGQSLIVDHLIDPGIFGGFFGDPRDELIAPEPGRAVGALVTHLHRDHTDVTAIERAVASDGSIHRPTRKPDESALEEFVTGEAEAALATTNLEVRSYEPSETGEVGPFSITALAASDGLGSPQVSWLISADSQTVLHAGDTMWHAAWWEIAAMHGPIDLAFLPGNGVEIDYPQRQPATNVPAVMTPEESVEAARALQARALVPIHFNRTFEHPDYYRPRADAGEQIERSAGERGVNVHFLEPGEWTEADILFSSAAESNAQD